MIPDHETHLVFISDLLPQRYPALAEAMKAALGKGLQLIPHTRDIWCRDFMPIQLAPSRFVQFRYQPDYLKGYEQLRTAEGGRLLGLSNCLNSDLVIDGGNVVRWHEAAILTEKVYPENPTLSRADLRRKLQAALEVDRLLMIPKEPWDAIGHADGVVRFIDANTVLVNDYAQVNPSYGKALARRLARHGLEVIPFPYCPSDPVGSDPGIGSAIGLYINFLQIKGTILCPAFGQEEDDQALKVLSQCFGDQRIIPIPCRDLAREGGVLNCVTWNICVDAGSTFDGVISPETKSEALNKE